MRKSGKFCRVTAFACAAAVVLGVAPVVAAQPLVLSDAVEVSSAYDISEAVLNPGTSFSEKEMAALSTHEAGAAGLDEVASGSALALVGAVVIVYFIWRYLQRNH